MARHRLPSRLATATGADLKNPRRYANRARPRTDPLGPPPSWLTEAERAAWEELADELPWLRASDRTLAAMAARLTARMRADPACGVRVVTELRLCLVAMGATPTARSRVDAGEEDDDDPALRYLT